MSDLISRQAAIDAVEARIKWFNGGAIEDRCKRDAFIQVIDEILTEIPSADRPTGKWIVKQGSHEYIRTSWYACDQCGGAGDISDKFCKHCGAKMEV